MIPNLKFLMKYMWLEYEKYSSAFTPLCGSVIAPLYVGEPLDNELTLTSAEIEVNGRIVCGDILFFDKLSEWNSYARKNPNHSFGVAAVVINIKDVASVSLSNLVIRCVIDANLLDDVLERVNSKRELCIGILSRQPSIYRRGFYERLIIERVEGKSNDVIKLYEECGSWERVFITMLFIYLRPSDTKARAALTTLARNINIDIITNQLADREEIEAYIFGLSGLLHGDTEDEYLNKLLQIYKDICEKNKIRHFTTYNWRGVDMHKLYINLAHLASFFSKKISFIAEIAYENKIKNLHSLLKCEASPYWKRHKDFASGEQKANRTITISTKQIERTIINVIVPTVIAYHKSVGDADAKAIEKMIELLAEVAAEDNAVVKGWQREGLTVKSAYESQAIIQLHKQYCNSSRCLECLLFSSKR